MKNKLIMDVLRARDKAEKYTSEAEKMLEHQKEVSRKIDKCIHLAKAYFKRGDELQKTLSVEYDYLKMIERSVTE